MSDDFDHSQATTVFVLGLLGVLLCQFLAPVAFIMGNKYKKACAMEGVEPEGLGTAGWVLGLVGSILLCLTFVILALYFVIIFVAVLGAGL